MVILVELDNNRVGGNIVMELVRNDHLISADDLERALGDSELRVFETAANLERKVRAWNASWGASPMIVRTFRVRSFST